MPLSGSSCNLVISSDSPGENGLLPLDKETKGQEEQGTHGGWLSSGETHRAEWRAGHFWGERSFVFLWCWRSSPRPCVLCPRCKPSSKQEVSPFNSSLIPEAFSSALEHDFHPTGPRHQLDSCRCLEPWESPKAVQSRRQVGGTSRREEEAWVTALLWDFNLCQLRQPPAFTPGPKATP